MVLHVGTYPDHYDFAWIGRKIGKCEFLTKQVSKEQLQDFSLSINKNPSQVEPSSHLAWKMCSRYSHYIVRHGNNMFFSKMSLIMQVALMDAIFMKNLKISQNRKIRNLFRIFVSFQQTKNVQFQTKMNSRVRNGPWRQKMNLESLFALLTRYGIINQMYCIWLLFSDH